MTTQPELQPCPFCGSNTASLVPDFEYTGGHAEIECGACQAYTWGETREEAIKTWNTRHKRKTTPARFNTNNEVWVQLTLHAIGLLMDYNDGLNAPHDIPANGEWTAFQLWELMSIFGEHCYNGGKQLFIDNIIRFTKPEEHR